MKKFLLILYFYCVSLLFADNLISAQNVTKSVLNITINSNSLINNTINEDTDVLVDNVFNEDINITDTYSVIQNNTKPKLNVTVSNSSLNVANNGGEQLEDQVNYDNEEEYDDMSPSEAVPRKTRVELQRDFDQSMSQFLDSGLKFMLETKNVFNEELNDSKSDNEAKDVWIAYSRSWGRVFDAAVKDIMPKIMMSSEANIDISMDCMAALIATVSGLKQQKDWAVKLYDSTGRPFTEGSLDGTVTNFGAYDQCLLIESDGNLAEPFIGQYCIVKYQMALPPKPKPLTLRTRIFNFTGTPVEGTFLDEFSTSAHAFYERYGRTGICIPSTCSAQDFQLVLNRFIPESHMNLSVNDCHTRVLPQFNSRQLTIVIIFSLILTLMILATSVDLILAYTNDSDYLPFITFETHLKKLLLDTLLAFSVYKNGKDLFNTTTRTSTNSAIECINGVRVLSMLWIIWTHTYLIPIKETFTFVKEFMFTVEELGFQLILNGWVLVDTFFLVGAMLTSYSVLHRMTKTDGKINVAQQITNRLFRFWPSVGVTVMLIFLIPALASGPLWKEYFDVQLDKCNRNWWKTLIFINNWYDESQMCLLHTWYLAADIQLFAISIVFVIMLYKNPNLAIKLIVLVATANSLAISVRTYILNQNPTVLYNTPDERDVYNQASTIYVNTYIHLGPYFVGLILGYYVFKYKTLKINPFINLFVWMAALFGCLGIMLSTYTLNRGEIWDPISAALYAGLHRTGWSMCVAWIIFGCTTGNGGPINTFLSWQLFAPLGKLSFMIYLMHFLVIWVRYAYNRQPLPFSHYTMFCEFIVNVMISIFVSIATHLAFEAPMMSLYNTYLSNVFKFATISVRQSPPKKSLESPKHISNIVVTSKL